MNDLDLRQQVYMNDLDLRHKTDFSHDKDISITVTDYCMYFNLIVLFQLVPVLQLVNFTAS